jgi:hypothetical protein
VVIVASTDQDQPRSHVLNSGEQPHTALNVMTIFTVVDGLVSFVIGLFIRNAPSAAPAWHIIATATGLAAILVGLYAQMISATREQRVLIVAGMIAGFVGLALGLSKGGFIA